MHTLSSSVACKFYSGSDGLATTSLPAASWHFPSAEHGGERPERKRLKSYPVGYFHGDIADVQTEEGKPVLFVAIDRTSKYAHAELHDKATRMVARDFLTHLILAIPCHP